MASSSSGARNYLSIGNGGVNPRSALYIIDQMFQRLKFDIGSEDDIRACDWFDLIVGSGHGGIIALLLGRLQMTTAQAIKVYNSLASVFVAEPTELKEERERNSMRVVDAFKTIMSDVDYAVDSPMRAGPEGGDLCKVAVCTLESSNATFCQFIRSYAIRGMMTPHCTILQAACATVASPDVYEPLILSDEDEEVTYIDAMAGYANPTNEMLKEAERLFGKNDIAATVISIGAGKLEQHQQRQGSAITQLRDIRSRATLDTERVHNDLQNRFQDLGIYYRFNVENVLPVQGSIGRTTRIQTMVYLEEAATSQRMDQAINSMQERKESQVLKELSMGFLMLFFYRSLTAPIYSIPSVEMKYRQRPGVVPFFVGRQDILGHLHETHIQDPSHERDYPTISVLTGLGGSGKTQIALGFARQFEIINPELLVFFVDASSDDRIKEDYQAIIRSRGIAYRSSTYENALQWLASADLPWLIIADNADDPDMDLHPFVPRCPRGHLIITTRNANQALMARNRTYSVEGLEVDHSVKLLLDVSGYGSTDGNFKHATTVVDTLGHLPLAIIQAAGYIYKHQCLSTYLELYHESREKILSHQVKEILHEYNLSVATTLEMSFNKLPIRSKQALCILSFLQNTSIPHSMIETAARNKFFYASGKASEADTEKFNDIKSDLEFYEIIEPCFQYSLLQRTISVNDQKFYSMHPLVQLWLQVQPILGSQFSSRSLARRTVVAVVQEGSMYQHFDLHQMLLPHIRMFAGQPLAIATDDALIYRVLSDFKDDSTAIIHMTSYLRRLDIVLEPNAPEKLKALRDLTGTLIGIGRNHEAVKTGEKALKLCMESLGMEHPLTLTSMVNLATAYTSVGRLEDACRFDEEALAKTRTVLGPEHLNTLTAMNCLAVDYNNLMEYEKARALYEETLTLRKRVLGPEHPDTLLSMSNLAAIYSHLGEYEKSQALDEETLRLCKRVLGPEHPDTLHSISNLAAVYSQLEEHERAQVLDKETLTLRKRVLGPEHPDTLLSISNLAVDCRGLGEYEKAQILYVEALALRKRVLGSEHPDTLTSMDSLAADYSLLEENDEAQALDEEAFTLLKRVLGPEHPDTLLSMSNLAADFGNLGEYKKAQILDAEALALRKRVLGSEHPDTLTSMNSLAADYSQLGGYEKARTLDEETLTLLKRILGPEHPDTLLSTNNLSCHRNFIQFKEAQKNLEKDEIGNGESIIHRENDMSKLPK
ncbi:TPR-like protein [Serendipita vermifera]|nr:TPR-like protein [Serendipita vermifera]